MSVDVNHVPISVDGVLDFVHPDGSVLSTITIEIADTPEAQAKGLMGRDALDGGHGMLFVFANIKVRKFHMTDTRIPLDIIFIDADGCIANIVQNAAPKSGRRYRSSGPVKYVVEVQGNFTQQFKINENICIRWRRIKQN
jgi:uncharacterized membrane protein (UPF0127 family)